MAVTDPVADMLTRIRNAAKAQKPTVEVPASNLKIEIAKKLDKYGFVKKFVVLEDNKQGMIKLLLNYKEGKSVIQGIERVSTPGRRVYTSSIKVPRALNGLGYFLVSTSKGVLSDHECRRLNIGGELLAKVW